MARVGFGLLVVLVLGCGHTARKGPGLPATEGGSDGSGGTAAVTGGASGSAVTAGEAAGGVAPLVPQPAGSDCTSADECDSGSCVDGHCCVDACATCEACTGPGGTCEALGLRQEDTEPADTCNGDHWCVDRACEQKAQVVVGREHTCALLPDGNVRCWGYGNAALGYGNTESIGDDEPASAGGNVDIGGRVVQLAAGYLHTCALLEGGSVRCWGSGFALGYPPQDGEGVGPDIGDDETPASAGDVPLAEKVLHLSAFYVHTCALFESGAVHCWGDVGEAEGGDLPLQEPAERVAVSYRASCTIGFDGHLRCFGSTPGDFPGVKLVAPGARRACALFADDSLRCWGDTSYGPVYVRPPDYDGESPVVVDPLSDVKQVASGDNHVCTVSSKGDVRCWGQVQVDGQLGRAGQTFGADNPSAFDPIVVGGAVEKLAVGRDHTCVLLSDARIRCWGNNLAGQLGYGHTEPIGDNETPASAGDVPYQ